MSVTVYPFHDGYLASLSVTEGAAVLGLKQVDGSRFEMKLNGLERLSVDGFREGNIVLDLRSVSGGEPTSEDLGGLDLAEIMEALFQGPHESAAEQFHQRHATFIAAKVDELSRGEATLVVLAPAYGADLLAYCASIDLLPLGQ